MRQEIGGGASKGSGAEEGGRGQGLGGWGWEVALKLGKQNSGVGAPDFVNFGGATNLKTPQLRNV